jgi:hypothetical protein
MSPLFSNSMEKLSLIRDRHVPFPSLFIIHENPVRGFQPFQPVTPDMPRDIRWQDWISTDDWHVFNNTSGSFICDKPQGNNDDNNIVSAQLQLPIMSAGGALSGECTLELNQNVIADIYILVATRAMPIGVDDQQDTDIDASR